MGTRSASNPSIINARSGSGSQNRKVPIPEVGAGCVNAHVRICAGGAGQTSVPTATRIARRVAEVGFKSDKGLAFSAARRNHPLADTAKNLILIVWTPPGTEGPTTVRRAALTQIVAL